MNFGISLFSSSTFLIWKSSRSNCSLNVKTVYLFEIKSSSAPGGIIFILGTQHTVGTTLHWIMKDLRVNPVVSRRIGGDRLGMKSDPKWDNWLMGQVTIKLFSDGPLPPTITTSAIIMVVSNKNSNSLKSSWPCPYHDISYESCHMTHIT